MECLHDLSQMHPHLGGDELGLHHQVILNLCGSTWQMIRKMYNGAHEQLINKEIRASVLAAQKASSPWKHSSDKKLLEMGGKLIETQNGSILEVDTAHFLNPKLTKRIMSALNCITDWVMYNPAQFLLHEDACMKFFDVLEAAAMGKLPVTQIASRQDRTGDGDDVDSGLYQATNR